MKKNLFYTIITLLIYSNLSSQGNLYIGAQAGFHFQTNPTNSRFIEDLSFSRTTTSTLFSLGGGFRGGILAGYLVSDYIGLELGINYQGGNTFSFSEKQQSSDITQTYQNNAIQIMPAILINPGLEFINPYGKFGLLLASNELIYKQDFNDGGMNFGSVEYKFTGGFNIGFFAAAGVSIPLSENINLFSELSFNVASFIPSSGNMEKYQFNGVSVSVNNFNNSERFLNFVDNIDLNAIRDPDKPTNVLKTSFSNNSVGLSLGTRIFF